MRDRPRKIEPSQFLSGWKEIANYLGKGVRTVQRYERHMGLPVRRPAGKPWGSVVATRAELDAWVETSPIREVYQLSNPFPEYASSARAIQRGLSEMLRLRDKMYELRAEVKESVRTLRESVHILQDGMSQANWNDLSASTDHSTLGYTSDELEMLEGKQFDLLKAPTKYPKAS